MEARPLSSGSVAPCAHCLLKPGNRPRGLCWQCYLTPAIRAKTPSTSKYARKGTRNFHARARPCTPTRALPGTEEKIAVLEGRSERGEELFHPRDAGWAQAGRAVLAAMRADFPQDEDDG